MTKVLHIITGLETGGAEAMLVRLAAGLNARGMEQQVVSLKGGGPNADALVAAGISVTELNFSLPRTQIELIRLVYRFKPSILQGWMYHGNIAASVTHRVTPGWGRRRLYWNIRASNVHDSRYARIIRWNARLSSIPDLVIANSQAGMDYHLETGFHPRRQMVIPNGIETDKFSPNTGQRSSMRRGLGFADSDVVAVSVARVNPMKDFDTLLAAIGSLPGVKGLLVGLGTDQLKLPDNVTALGLRHDVSELHSAADIIVSSSAYGEGFSNALAEGMSSGLVPVATDVGDAANIIGDTGTVVRPGDPVSLGQAIKAIASLPHATIRDRGLKARQRIVENFSLERAVQRFADIYEDIGV